MAIGVSSYREIERKTHDHKRQTYTPMEPRADILMELRDQRNEEPTGNRRRDYEEPYNVGETVTRITMFKNKKGLSKLNMETKLY